MAGTQDREEGTEVAGKDRKKELARQRYERQVERRAEKYAKTRRVKVVVGASVAVALLGGGTALAAGFTPYAKKPGKPAAAEQPKPAPKVSVKPGECAYQPHDLSQVPAQMQQQMQQATRDVGTPPKQPDRKGSYTETIKTNLGDVVIDLDTKAACTVNSFKFLADKDFFDGSSCHRLVTDGLHVLQCGDPSGTGMGGPRYRFGNENLPEADTKNPQKPVTYPAGTVAMANSGAAESNGSQFFMVYDDTKLPPQYTRLGTVVEGMDILQKVAEAGTESDDPQAGGGPPKESVKIKDLTVAKK